MSESPDFKQVFQRMDETIADVCLRELNLSDSRYWFDDRPMLAPERIGEVYRLGRPLILHLIKADKSPMKNMKKLSIARSMMDAGKKNMECKNTYDALNMYNKAVVFAPELDDNMARACAERAACLLELGDYSRALVDVAQAEQYDYQFERRFELEERKGLAYLGLQQLELAKEAFNKAISLLDDAAGFLQKKFVERKMGELTDRLRSCIYQNQQKTGDNKGHFHNLGRLANISSRNKKYPALSDKVEVFQNGMDRKRTIFTSLEVQAGEVIGVEKPIVSFLEKDYVKTNCWHCLVTVKAPYGCPLCSAVKFCSRECLREACSSYHPSECLLTDIIMSNRIASWHLAYRAVASKPLKQTLLVGKNGMSPVYTSNDLNNLLNLEVPNVRVSTDEMKKRTVMSVFYLILLQMTGYFDTNEDDSGKLNPSLSSIHQMKGKENDSSLSEAELHIAMLIDRIISITPFYTTEVCHFEMQGGGEWTAGKVTPVIGKSINPTLALAKHSCYPTAARVCCANQTLLVAQKNMRSGEAVTINYSAPFYTASKQERQGFLSSGYELNCECDACTQDWPLFDLLPPGPQGLSDADVEINGFKSMDFGMSKLVGPTPILTPTERNILDTFNRVRAKLGQVQRTICPGEPPSKVMIQNQVRLFRCLLAMYSTKMCITKTQYGSLHLPV